MLQYCKLLVALIQLIFAIVAFVFPIFNVVGLAISIAAYCWQEDAHSYFELTLAVLGCCLPYLLFSFLNVIVAGYDLIMTMR